MSLAKSTKEAQADFPEIPLEENQLKIRPLEKIKLYSKEPIEPSAYGKGKGYSRPWILQDGRKVIEQGSEMRDSYRVPKKVNFGEGKNKRNFCIYYVFGFFFYYY